MAEKGRPLPKFGEWDVNDPASAEGYTVIFNKARNEKRTGGSTNSPPKGDPAYNKQGATLGKPQSSNGSTDAATVETAVAVPSEFQPGAPGTADRKGESKP